MISRQAGTIRSPRFSNFIHLSEPIHMRLQRLILLGGLASLMGACKHDAGPFYPEVRQSAFVRYINAVPDTGLLDFKFIDKVEGSAWYDLQAFRGVTNYQAVDAGARHIRVFNGSNSLPMNEPSYVTAFHVDTTLTFEADKYYTVLHVGNARGKQSYLWVIEDTRPSVPTGQIEVRAIHAGVGLGAVDVRAAADTSATLNGTPLFSGVTFKTVTPYAQRATGKFVSELANAGAATQLSEVVVPAGAAAVSSSQSQQGGYSISGSLLTAFIFSPSVVGSPAPQGGAFARATIVWLQDNRP